MSNQSKRLAFSCWNCEETYTLLRKLTENKKLFVACPFCDEEAVVDLTPYEGEATSVYRGEGTAGFADLELPEVLPTERRSES